MGLALAAGCVAEFATGPIMGLYLANRSLRQYPGLLRMATVGAVVMILSLILDAFISHTQDVSLQFIGNSNFLYQNISAHTNISRFFDPAAAFFLTHVGIIVGWVVAGVPTIVAVRRSRRRKAGAT